MRRPSNRRNPASLLAATGAVVAVLAATWPQSVSAAVRTDGSLGGPATTLTGPNFAVGPNLGQIRGGNLFHSFSQLDLAAGETATFSGPTSIGNVLARVTGGLPSSIDGTISCTIPGANFYLVNPSGVVFGANAHLDVSGSFAVTTADVVKLTDGGTFNARVPVQSVLTSAPPAAFGFLGPQPPAAVDFQGASLAVASGKGVSVIAGPVNVHGGQISAPAGRINVVPVGGAGDVALDPSSTDGPIDSSGVHTFADVTLDQNALVDASGPAGGRVVIRAGKLLLKDDATLRARTLGAGTGRGIDIVADGVRVEGGGFVSSGARDGSTGDAGPITITADTIELDGSDGQGAFSGIFASSSANATGRGGDVVLDVATALRITNGAFIDVGTFGTGNGGNIDIHGAGSVEIDAQQAGSFSTGLFAMVTGASLPSTQGGSIHLDVGSLAMRNQGEINADVNGAGSAGQVSIKAGSVSMESASVISTEVGFLKSGQGGKLTLDVGGDIVIRDRGTTISSSTNGKGNGGNLYVTAHDILIDGANGTSDILPGLQADSNFDLGKGGNIYIKAHAITLQDHGTISALTGLFDGDGGNIAIDTDSLTVARAERSRPQTLGGGLGGAIDITASGAINIQGQANESTTGIIASSSGAGRGGNISLNGAGTLHLGEGGAITASTSSGGSGGDVTVDLDSVVLDGYGARITASSSDAGPGGTATVRANSMSLANSGSITSESNASGIGGVVNITVAGHLNIDGLLSHVGAGSSGTAAGGNVNVDAGTLTLANGGHITADTSGIGAGGNATVHVTGRMLVTGTATDPLNAEVNLSRVSAATTGTGQSGRGGDVSVSGGTLRVEKGARLAASTDGTGSGGAISVDVQRAEVVGGALTSEASGAGDAGSIRVKASDSVVVSQGGSVSTRSLQSNAGAITLEASNTIKVNGKGTRVTAQAAGEGGGLTLNAPKGVISVRDAHLLTEAGGNGGNITVDPDFVLLNHAVLSANAGVNGGDVTIRPDVLLVTPDTLITATGVAGVSGTVDVTSPDTTLASSLARLPADLASAGLTLQPQCGATTSLFNVSSFLVNGRGGVRPAPDDWHVHTDLRLADPEWERR